MKRSDVIKVIEASYAVERGMQSWIEGVHAALAPVCEKGLGSISYRYDLSSTGITVLETAEHDAAVDADAMKTALTTVTDDYIDQATRTRPCGMASAIPSFDVQPAVHEFFRPAGVRDIFVVNAIDPSGTGVMFGAFHPKKSRLSPAALARYAYIAAHMSAGFRLQRRLATAEARAEGADAVVTPDGRLVHAERGAKGEEARASLVAAARAIDRARGKLRRSDPDDAVRRWKALVSGEWSLVEQFETDGKRYLVAKANALQTPDVDDIPPRERQVLTYAALGHHNKLIAYELGIAASTVRVLLMRAARRLGTRTRNGTIDAFVASTGRSSST